MGVVLRELWTAGEERRRFEKVMALVGQKKHDEMQPMAAAT